MIFKPTAPMRLVSSMPLANHTVQVNYDAKARPTITHVRLHEHATATDRAEAPRDRPPGRRLTH
jgi:hypothetical protein